MTIEIGICWTSVVQEKLLTVLRLLKQRVPNTYKVVNKFFFKSDKRQKDETGNFAYYWSLPAEKDSEFALVLDFLESFFAKLDELEHSDQYCFIYLGSAWNDIKVKGTFVKNSFGMRLNRELSVKEY